MNVLLIGRTQTLYETALALRDRSEHRIVGVITGPSAPEYSRKEDDFHKLAESCGAPFRCAKTIDAKLIEFARRCKADIAVSVNWMSIIGESFIDLFPCGVLNAHLGDLPRYRGNAVLNWPIINGESDVALTVHFMDPGELDSGDILAQRRFPLTDETTVADVFRFIEQTAPALFTEAIDGLAAGTIQPRPQNDSPLSPVRCYPRLPRDGRIDWTAPPRDVDALVRAVTRPYSGAFTYYRDRDGRMQKLMVWSSRIVAEQTPDVGVPGHVIRNDRDTGESWVLCGEGILALQRCSHAEGGVDFEPGKQWRSVRMRLGMDIEGELYHLIRRTELDERMTRTDGREEPDA